MTQPNLQDQLRNIRLSLHYHWYQAQKTHFDRMHHKCDCRLIRLKWLETSNTRISCGVENRMNYYKFISFVWRNKVEKWKKLNEKRMKRVEKKIYWCDRTCKKITVPSKFVRRDKNMDIVIVSNHNPGWIIKFLSVKLTSSRKFPSPVHFEGSALCRSANNLPWSYK
jgi:hypothetical protein